MRVADDLVNRVVTSSRIPRRRRREIQRELRSHIEELVLTARAAGRHEDEIKQLVLASFGEPEQIAQGFSWVYRHEWRTLRALAFTLSAALLASSLLALALATQAGLAFGLGRPVLKALVSPHTVIEALDIVAGVTAYLGVTWLESMLRSHRLHKATALLTAILATLLLSWAAAEWHLALPLFGFATGLFFGALQLFVAPSLVRVAIVVVCFPLLALVWAQLRASLPHSALTAIYTSWLVLGIGYQVMTHLAARLDAALMSGLERLVMGY